MRLVPPLRSFPPSRAGHPAARAASGHPAARAASGHPLAEATRRFAVPSLACVLVLAAALAPAPLRAQEWRSADGPEGASAGYTQAGRPAGVAFRCEGSGRIRTLVAGNGTRFGEGQGATLVFSVDGLATMLAARAEPEPRGSGSRFARTDAAGDLAPLFDALRKGRELELSSPAGHVRLPLTGSGRALGALLERCR